MFLLHAVTKISHPLIVIAVAYCLTIESNPVGDNMHMLMRGIVVHNCNELVLGEL